MLQTQRAVALQYRAKRAHSSLSTSLAVVKNLSAVLSGTATILDALIKLCKLVDGAKKEE